MSEKDFLKNHSYPADSNVNRRFEQYKSILCRFEELMLEERYQELEEMVNEIRKSLYR
jgi:hypothetical protein